MHRSLIPVFLLCLTMTAAELLYRVEPLPLSGPERLNGLAVQAGVWGDRCEYWDDDEVGQFYASVPAVPATIRLLQGDRELASAAVPTVGKVHFRIATRELPPGNYSVTVGAGAFAFTRAARRQPPLDFPADGVPILFERLPEGDARWAVRASVPLPPGAVTGEGQLVLTQDGQPIPCSLRKVATWAPDGSWKWVHLRFTATWRQGQPAEYRLRRGTPPPAAAAFSGADLPALVGGLYAVDERGIRWEAALDADATVTIEEQSAVHAVVRAEGWLANPDVADAPLCRFVLRLVGAAGSPVVRVQQQVILACDTRQHQLADIGFAMAAPGDRLAAGIDGRTVEGALPAKGEAFLHQDRHDRLRLVGLAKEPAAGSRSDGWFAIGQGERTAGLLVKDIWQKFPKEVSWSKEGLVFHAWPAHGHRAFTLDEELDERHIYKFRAFHQHRLLDLQLPADYFARFKELPGTFENTAEIAQTGIATGAAIANEFAIVPEAGIEDLPALARLFQTDPVGRTPGAWVAGTRVFGPIAAADRTRFAAVEEAVEEGFLSYTRSVERGQEYGMWNYADTHTYWNVEGDYSQLHRVWHNSHYHEAGLSWLLYARGGGRRLLDWARASTDHYVNIGTVNWAPPGDPRLDYSRYENAPPVYVDGKLQASRRHWWLLREPFPEAAPWYAFIDAVLNRPAETGWHPRFIVPGAMYHCKGLTHWGKKDYAMEGGEAHAWIWGHWMDPDASLWAWYVDVQSRARDVYEMWHQSIRAYGLPRSGVAREINTALACAVNLYEATWDADLLPAIHGMARSLRTAEPLDRQAPGCMWHPLWINRYYHLTRDPEYLPFIREYGANPTTADALGLPALAYETSGENRYLEPYLDRLRDWPNQFFHRPGDPYDWYGQGPGPLGSRWWWLTWPEFRYQLERAGVADFSAVPPAGGDYPGTGGRFDQLDSPASITVYLLEETDAPLPLRLTATGLGGDLHPVSMVVYAPSGKPVWQIPRVPPQGGPSRWTETPTLPADGETGLYRAELRCHAVALSAPLSAGQPEASLLRPDTPGWAWRINGWLMPLAEGDQTVTLTLASKSERSPLNYRVLDAAGGLVGEGSLFEPRGLTVAEVALQPANHPPPWQVQATGRMIMTVKCGPPGCLLGADAQSVHRLARELPNVHR